MKIRPEDWLPSEGITLPDKALEIVKETTKNIAVIAGPGSGKTELLAQRASFLLETGQCVYPQKILALCFKVDAASNIKKRIEKRCGKLSASRFVSSTFDSFFISMVRRFSAFLPDWINTVSSDFNVQAFNKNWWVSYKQNILKGVDNPFESAFNNPDRHSPMNLNNIEDPRLRDIWNYCVEENCFDWHMCRSMAYTIIKNSVGVKKIISSTYKFVFLDEFQDTTTPQYEFVKEVFNLQDSIITTVGDSNQMIMGWAGADLEVFNKFASDFNAEKKILNINHRSNEDIVNFINYIISEITPENEESISYVATRPASEENSLFAGEFETKKGEAASIASYISGRLNENAELCPNDFALILRQKTADYFTIANPEFLQNNLMLRNEDEQICENGIKIQDLMDEPISDFFINIVRKKENLITPEQNKELINALANLKNYEISDERKYKKLIDDLNKLIEYVNLSENTNIWTNKIILKIGRKSFKKIKMLSNESDFTKIKLSFDALFQEALTKTENVKEAIDYYNGEGQIKLMTIHKSKGLEFNTVFFVDFNADAWWGIGQAINSGNTSKVKEEQNAFFVGASRAREQLIFTNGQKDKWPPIITKVLMESKMLQIFP